MTQHGPHSVIGQEDVEVGILLDHRPSTHPWQDAVLSPAGLVPQAMPADPRGVWREVRRDGPNVRYLAGTLRLSLFPRETEGYVTNLTQAPPRAWIVLRTDPSAAADHDLYPFHVTACPFEAQVYLDNGEDVVEPVALPDVLTDWLRDFVERHHVETPFRKRRRGPKDTAEDARAPFEPPADSPPRREEDGSR